jgi:hypothetical protein
MPKNRRETTMMEQKAVTVQEFRKMVGIGRNLAYSLLNAPGGVRALKVGPRRWVIPVAEVERFLAQAGAQGGQ